MVKKPSDALKAARINEFLEWCKILEPWEIVELWENVVRLWWDKKKELDN